MAGSSLELLFLHNHGSVENVPRYLKGNCTIGDTPFLIQFSLKHDYGRKGSFTFLAGIVFLASSIYFYKHWIERMCAVLAVTSLLESPPKKVGFFIFLGRTRPKSIEIVHILDCFFGG